MELREDHKSDVVRQIAQSPQESTDLPPLTKDPLFWGVGLVSFVIVLSCSLGVASFFISDNAAFPVLVQEEYGEYASRVSNTEPSKEALSNSVHPTTFSLPSTRAFEEARASAQGIVIQDQSSIIQSKPYSQFGLKLKTSEHELTKVQTHTFHKSLNSGKTQAVSGETTSSQADTKPSSDAGSSSSTAEPLKPSKGASAQDIEEARISISVSSSVVGGGVSFSGSMPISQARTPYAALVNTGLSVNARSSQFGIYVAAIGGLAEKEHGSSSGWMYSINGRVPMQSASSYELKPGDALLWFYVR